MKIQTSLIALMLMLFLSACSTTQVGMAYSPDPAKTSSVKAAPVVEVGTVSDSRKHDLNWLGAIRGGYGNPLKTLETEKPVSEVVRTALTDGLSAYHMLSGNNPRYTLNVDVAQFDCNQVGRREAHILLKVSLVNVASKQTVYSNTIKSDKVTGSMITLDAGLFASVEDLRQVANDVLQDAVDKLLSDPAFTSNLS